jgi:hypothetical protein
VESHPSLTIALPHGLQSPKAQRLRALLRTLCTIEHFVRYLGRLLPRCARGEVFSVLTHICRRTAAGKVGNRLPLATMASFSLPI